MFIELQDISIRYGSVWVLENINFSLKEGKTLLLTGKNGAGKTTLLRLLATILKPTRGLLSLFGVPVRDSITRYEVRKNLLLNTHENYFYDNLTAFENLNFLTNLSQISKNNIFKSLKRVSLIKDTHKEVRFYSAGMKRRLMFARTLLFAPKLVLLDEPFAQLDDEGIELVEGIIRDLQKNNTTLVLCTHDIERGKKFADIHLEMCDKK